MALLTRLQVILFKKESSYGTDPTPTGSANAILVGNLDVTPLNATTVQRNIFRAYLGNAEEFLAEYNSLINFDVELAGVADAGDAPAWGPLLEACGFDETLTADTSAVYTPISTGFVSGTIYYYRGGVLHKATGCRGSVAFTINVKGIPVMRYSFIGKHVAPTDTSLPECDYSAFQLPKVANTANTTGFSIHGFSGYLESLSLDLAGETPYRTLIGFEQVTFVDRKPSGQLVIEAPLIASKDFYTIAKNGTLGALSIIHGTVAGNRVKLDCPKVSIQNPTYSDSQGVSMLTLPFKAVPDEGDDEIVVTVY